MKTDLAPDPRDDADVDAEEINSKSLWAMYSVFSLKKALPDDMPVDTAEKAVLDTGVEIRGFYDVGGFKADADLMMWTLADDPAKIQAAYHALRSSDLGRYLKPEWSAAGMHTPAEFNRAHVPSCFAGVEPRAWICVYPFVRSYEWYGMPDEERSRIMSEHGRNGGAFPDCPGSTLASFALGDYEWVLAFESDELRRLVEMMQHQRKTEARLHVRKETPFFTGPRLQLSEWVSRQPKRG